MAHAVRLAQLSIPSSGRKAARYKSHPLMYRLATLVGMSSTWANWFCPMDSIAAHSSELPTATRPCTEWLKRTLNFGHSNLVLPHLRNSLETDLLSKDRNG
jgi:hypothetical protein